MAQPPKPKTDKFGQPCKSGQVPMPKTRPEWMAEVTA